MDNIVLIEKSKINEIVDMLKEMRFRSYAKKKIDRILKILNEEPVKSPESPSLLVEFK